MKIYIVFGWAGEYSDREEWPVAAYSDEKLAQDHVRLATRESAKSIIEHEKLSFDEQWSREGQEGGCTATQYDRNPGKDSWYAGEPVEYFVAESVFCQSIREYLSDGHSGRPKKSVDK